MTDAGGKPSEDGRDVEVLEEHPVKSTTRITLGGETPEERKQEFTDALRDIPVNSDDSTPMCGCGEAANDGPHRANCPACGARFVPKLCPVCGRRGQLQSVEGSELCPVCVDKLEGDA